MNPTVYNPILYRDYNTFTLSVFVTVTVYNPILYRDYNQQCINTLTVINCI